MDQFTTYVASRRSDLVKELQKLVSDAIHVYFDEHNSKSFSHIVNTLIMKCPTEYMIFLSDKARPEINQIDKMKDLVLSGRYGFVALHRFGAFCIDKDLIRKIGFLDEGYIRGGFEDDDFIIRIREADIAIYESEELPLLQLPSSFNYDNPYIHFKEKWSFQPKSIIRLQSEAEYPKEYYDSLQKRPVERPPTNFGKWEESCFLVNGHHNHKKYSNPVSTFITNPIHLRTIEPLQHITFLKLFASLIKPKVYLEYGVGNGTCFNTMIEETRPYNTRCIGVDIESCMNYNSFGEYYKMSTDNFVIDVLPNLNIVIDLVFIDACHTAEQCLKDFESIFPYIAEDGLIFLHDTYPNNETFTGPDYCGTAYLSAWKIRNNDYYRNRC
ncbi:MAG: class I SAM-dependent methyltransferase [Candidatus Paceibacterota bacterium]